MPSEAGPKVDLLVALTVSYRAARLVAMTARRRAETRVSLLVSLLVDWLVVKKVGHWDTQKAASWGYMTVSV